MTLESIKNNVTDFKGTAKDFLYIRTKSRMIHIYGRIERMKIDFEIPENLANKNEAMATLLTLEADLEEKVKNEKLLPQDIDLPSTFAFNQPTSSPHSLTYKTVPIYK